MGRPSRQIDQLLLGSGRVLYPLRGCAGLSVRELARHAGVTASMFHYHFDSKDAFLRTLLDGFYDEVFSRLSLRVAEPGTALARLRGALLLIGAVVREHGAVLQRVLTDAAMGESVAADFVRRNMPRHVGLLLALLDEAERAGDVAPQPPFTRLTFLLGAVAAPALIGQQLHHLSLLASPLAEQLPAQVLADDAIAARADMALRALAPATSATPVRNAP